MPEENIVLTKRNLDTGKPLERLCCFTCLLPKPMSAFIYNMHTGKYAPRGPKTPRRMCKECMLRKRFPGLRGRWWIEGPFIREHSIMAPPVKISILDHVLGRAQGLREQRRLQRRVGDHGVCGKCRREREVLFWGCGNCFRGVLDTIIHQDLLDRNPIEQAIYRLQVHCVRCIDWWNRHAVVERPLQFADVVSHGREFVTCLFMGLEQFRYVSWKDRRPVGSRGDDQWTTERRGSGSPCDPVGRFWESRCAPCWRRIRPRAYHFRDRVDACLIAKLEESELCSDCQQETRSASTLKRPVETRSRRSVR